MIDLFAWLILGLPLLAAAAITLFTLPDAAKSARLSIGAVLLAFLGSLILWARDATGEPAVTWLALGTGTGGLQIELGLKLDPLSRLMLLVVTGVGSAIHIYSWGYLHADRNRGRYFAGLSLFTFAMLGIVLANNFLMLFIFWELVGVSSYLLIGFWFARPAAAEAAKKAFLTNRLGDFGFLLGIILVWAALGTLSFTELEARLADDPAALGAAASVAGLLIFCGAMGKSAQFPLHVWLPDAMEGPTPVSALIHAATMVAAGVYMLCRVFFVLAVPGSVALELIAWIGGVTALLAALLAVQQNDIKRILAYSTLSQLGYMVLAVGVSGASRDPSVAMYHLTTHAGFKALLFLGAGSVIHALHHEQDIWKMGGLSRRLPITFWTFLLATLALCGVPPLSGFYSKDAIIARTLESGHHGLFALATLVAALTTFYMFRLVFVAFTGPAKSQAADHARESPPVMTLPLLALAVPSVLAGFWGIHRVYGAQYGAEPAAAGSWAQQLVEPFAHAPLAAGAGLAAALMGWLGAWAWYRAALQDPLPARFATVARWLRDRLYFDELYERLIGWTQESLARLADGVDRWVIMGVAVKGTHGTFELLGRLLRLAQTGNLQTYAFVLVAGVALLLFLVMAR